MIKSVVDTNTKPVFETSMEIMTLYDSKYSRDVDTFYYHFFLFFFFFFNLKMNNNK